MKRRKTAIGLKLPDGYRRTFVFDNPATGFRFEMVVVHDGIYVANDDPGGASDDSACLDWIGECMELVRKDLA